MPPISAQALAQKDQQLKNAEGNINAPFPPRGQMMSFLPPLDHAQWAAHVQGKAQGLGMGPPGLGRDDQGQLQMSPAVMGMFSGAIGAKGFPFYAARRRRRLSNRETTRPR